MGSSWHWIIILVVALLLFGRRLPEMMRGLGSSIREFKKGIDVGDPTDTNFPDGANSRPANPPPAVKPPAPPPAQNQQTQQQAAEPAKDEAPKS